MGGERGVGAFCCSGSYLLGEEATGRRTATVDGGHRSQVSGETAAISGASRCRSVGRRWVRGVPAVCLLCAVRVDDERGFVAFLEPPAEADPAWTEMSRV